MSGRRAAVFAALALATGAVAGAACGVPTDDGPKVADPGDVPFELLDPSAGPSTTRPTVPRPVRPVPLYFVQSGRVVPVARALPEPVTLSDVRAALVAGPTRDEEADGVRSPLVGREAIASLSLSGGVASVDLGTPFVELGASDQLLAVGQIVLTLTAQPGVGRVEFSLQGAPIEVPRGDGSLTSQSVSRDDYAALLDATG